MTKESGIFVVIPARESDSFAGEGRAVPIAGYAYLGARNVVLRFPDGVRQVESNDLRIDKGGDVCHFSRKAGSDVPRA